MTTRQEFIRDMVKDRATWERVLHQITRVVQRSFTEDRERSGIVLLSVVPNETEIKRRTHICYDWFARMRTDLHYSTPRALDMLPRALRSTIDGVDWEPPTPERGWSPPKE